MLKSEEIWAKFASRLLNFLHKKLGNREMAEDLLQEIFMTIHLKISQLKDEKKLESWVFQIANNKLNDFFRQKKDFLDVEKINLKEEVSLLDKNHLEDCLIPFVESLPQIYKESLLMSDLQGVKIKDISAQLKISESGVKSRVQRAREMIKQHFVDCCHLHINKDGKLSGEHRHSHESWNCNQNDCLIHQN